MKARVSKSFNQLSTKDKEKVFESVQNIIDEQINENAAELQKIWLKMSCILLNKLFDFNEEQCILYLANWQHMYRTIGQMNKEEETKYLEENINKIFVDTKYPETFIKSLEK